MIFHISKGFLKYTDRIESISISESAQTIGHCLAELLNRFPQLFIHLMDNGAEVANRSVLLLNDQFLTDPAAMTQEIEQGDELRIEITVPYGEDGESWLPFLAFVGIPIDPITCRLMENKQVFGIQGYGWTMPGMTTVFGKKTADTLAFYVMRIAGYVMQVVGFILGWTGVGVAVALAGAALVAMSSLGDPSLIYPDISVAGNVDPCTLSRSATYTFNGIQNTTAAGTPFQIVYGTHRVGGQLLNVYTTSDAPIVYSDQSTVTNTNLWLQIGLCEGEIAGITEPELDKLPYTYYNAIDIYPAKSDYFRPGSQWQEVMADFSEIQGTLTKGNKIP